MLVDNGVCRRRKDRAVFYLPEQISSFFAADISKTQIIPLIRGALPLLRLLLIAAAFVPPGITKQASSETEWLSACTYEILGVTLQTNSLDGVSAI